VLLPRVLRARHLRTVGTESPDRERTFQTDQPSLFDVLVILGRDKVLARLRAVVD
jgi:hypothetical protein